MRFVVKAYDYDYGYENPTYNIESNMNKEILTNLKIIQTVILMN